MRGRIEEDYGGFAARSGDRTATLELPRGERKPETSGRSIMQRAWRARQDVGVLEESRAPDYSKLLDKSAQDSCFSR